MVRGADHRRFGLRPSERSRQEDTLTSPGADIQAAPARGSKLRKG